MFEKLLDFDTHVTLFFNGGHSTVMDSIMLAITSTIVWVPLGLFMLYYIYRTQGWRTMLFVVLGIALCIVLADGLSSGICKPLVGRLRPTRDPAVMNLVNIVGDYRGGRYGFFSSHAANTMSVAVFFSLIFRRKVLTVLFVVFSLLNCWSRLYLGVHYFFDIIVGLVWGVATGFMVYALYRRMVKVQSPMSGRPIAIACLSTYLAILLLASLLF